jgi:dihydrofolate reductase
VTISLVVAVAENGVIGRGGNLPWHLPRDLERFRRLTSGHSVIMGRKTLESIGEPLPNRRNIVLTNNRELTLDGVEIVHELKDALAATENEEVFVIGGAEVFATALDLADRIYLTLVHAEFEGDRVFGDFDVSDWVLLEEEFHGADERHQHSFTFKVYERRN